MPEFFGKMSASLIYIGISVGMVVLISKGVGMAAESIAETAQSIRAIRNGEQPVGEREGLKAA